MKILRSLEKETGEQWTGVLFLYKSRPAGKTVSRPMRICEAIAESCNQPLVILPELIECPGARRSLALGWFKSAELALEISKKTGISKILLNQLIENTPRLDSPVSALALGKLETPDVVVSYLHPDAAMKIIRRWQEVNGRDIATTLSSFMAVCGSGIVKAQQSGEICFSFGCPDSRKYGKIRDDQLVVSMPYQSAKRLIEEG
ncbi:MAG TPA: DUF169 domain-containing protein [archaeon]|nr:DUF169 domain-containing protein [archaeon]